MDNVRVKMVDQYNGYVEIQGKKILITNNKQKRLDREHKEKTAEIIERVAIGIIMIGVILMLRVACQLEYTTTFNMQETWTSFEYFIRIVISIVLVGPGSLTVYLIEECKREWEQ